MTPSIRGGQLPENAGDFQQLRTEQLRYKACYLCEGPFSSLNVRSAAGWRETQISGTCENCYDELFKDAKDSGVDEL